MPSHYMKKKMKTLRKRKNPDRYRSRPNRYPFLKWKPMAGYGSQISVMDILTSMFSIFRLKSMRKNRKTTEAIFKNKE